MKTKEQNKPEFSRVFVCFTSGPTLHFRNMIKFLLLVNRQAKVRLSRFYGSTDLKERHRLQREIPQLVLARKSRQCNFIEYQDIKIVYKRYASLYFIVGIEADDNELMSLEIIHRLVECLDRFYGNVCELDLIFGYEDAYAVVDEVIGGHGGVVEMGIRTVVETLKREKDISGGGSGNAIEE